MGAYSRDWELMAGFSGLSRNHYDRMTWNGRDGVG
jgi:hypothetical protein